MGCGIVVIGASWGGLDALGTVLRALSPGFAAPVAVAQHRSPHFERSELADQLGRRGALPVADAEDKQPIAPGRVYLAPPDYHLLVEPGAFSLSVDAPVLFSRPSIDVLFESAADAYGERATGVLLTGANADGAAGLARIRARGGLTIVQDPAGAAQPAMPEAAIAAGGAQRVLALDEIAPLLNETCGSADSSRRAA
jgi:two-component system chemotaxis response regulator CheB